MLLLLRIERHGFGFIGRDSQERERLPWREREDECFSGTRYLYTFTSRETAEEEEPWKRVEGGGRPWRILDLHPSPREFSRNVRFSIETFRVREGEIERERYSLPHPPHPRRRQFQTTEFEKIILEAEKCRQVSAEGHRRVEAERQKPDVDSSTSAARRSTESTNLIFFRTLRI